MAESMASDLDELMPPDVRRHLEAIDLERRWQAIRRETKPALARALERIKGASDGR